MKKEMLINVLQAEECRIAILENGVLEELYVERTGHESYVGNIYKGRIVNIEPSIQAAFVDFGVGRNGFLHVSDVEPAYYRHLEGDGGRRSPRDRHRGGDDRRGGGGGGGGGHRPRFEPEDIDEEELPSIVNDILPEAVLIEDEFEDVVMEAPLHEDEHMEGAQPTPGGPGDPLERPWPED